MKSRSKRFFKRLFKMAKIPVLIGIGLLIGVAISEDSHSSRQSNVIHSDQFGDEIAQSIERQIEDRIEQQIEIRIERQIEDRIVIPPIPAIPDIPEIPAIPDIPDSSGIHTNVHIERTPSFWDVLNGIGTILASMILIGLGGMMLIRRWRQPKEKSPESVGM